MEKIVVFAACTISCAIVFVGLVLLASSGIIPDEIRTVATVVLIVDLITFVVFLLELNKCVLPPKHNKE